MRGLHRPHFRVTICWDSNPQLADGPFRQEAMHEEKYPLIAHPFDPQFTFLRSLQSPSGRLKTGKYIIEGIRHVARAVEQRAPLELLFVAPSALSNPFGQKLARRIRQSNIPCIRLSQQLYNQLSLAAEPQGIGAVLRQQWLKLSDLKVASSSLWLAIESVDQPGNLGTILRTAEAAGVSGIVLLGEVSDPWDPGCIRASMGSIFSQRLVRCEIRDFIAWARRSGIALVASSPRGLITYSAFRCRWPAGLLIGSERNGLSEQLLDAADFNLRIPMQGGCDSINAAVAAGILVFAMSGQRRS
jgi:TrmH family RNA methyltransferase